jgi:hypothetical protein
MRLELFPAHMLCFACCIELPYQGFLALSSPAGQVRRHGRRCFVPTHSLRWGLALEMNHSERGCDDCVAVAAHLEASCEVWCVP